MTDNITYEDVLKPAHKMNMDMVRQYTQAAALSDEQQKEAVREILMQPYMKDVYRSQAIKPCDVAEFVEEMTNTSWGQRTSIISNFASSVLSVDQHGNMDGNINGVRETLVLQENMKKNLADKTKRFAEKKKAENAFADKGKKLSKTAKLLKKFLKAGRVVVLAMGICGTTYVASTISKMYGFGENDDTQTKKSNDKSDSKADIAKTISWNKAIERD